jgi:hypothetical protein
MNVTLGDGPLGAFAYTIVNDLWNNLQAYTLESFPKSILPIVNESIESLGADATEQERQHERMRLQNIIFTKINIAKEYFINHFITSNINRPPRISDNNFGHLHLMFEAFALTDPENMGKIISKFNNNMDLIIQYIREKLQILINMDRIDLTMFTGNIGPYIAIAVYFFTAKMLANIIKACIVYGNYRDIEETFNDMNLSKLHHSFIIQILAAVRDCFPY